MSRKTSSAFWPCGCVYLGPGTHLCTKDNAQVSLDEPKVEVTVSVIRQGRGKLPWVRSPDLPRVILDANGAVVGMLDTGDIAKAVVEAVNRGAITDEMRAGVWDS